MIPTQQISGTDPLLPITREVKRFIAGALAGVGGASPRLHRTVISAVEKTAIAEVITHCRGNQVQASRLLGVNRNTLRERMWRYGIKWTWR